MAGILLSYNNAMFQGTGEILILTSAEWGDAIEVPSAS